MNTFTSRGFLLATLAFTCFGASAQIGGNFLGTRWVEAGKAVRLLPDGTGPGSSNWSIVAPGIGIDPRPGRPDTAHAGDTLTLNSDQLLPASSVRRPADIFKAALNKWQIAAGNQWGSIGLIEDSGDAIGAMGAVNGDMRVAVIKDEIVFDGAAGNPNFDDLAHAFQPDTFFLGWHPQGWGSIGGDIHFRPSIVQDPANGIRFVDSLAPGANEYDLETVMLHEIGHALGLDHSPADPTSIMRPKYSGVQRVLGVNDIFNIRLLYTATPVPEPAAGLMLACGAVVLALLRRRRAPPATAAA